MRLIEATKFDNCIIEIYIRDPVEVNKNVYFREVMVGEIDVTNGIISKGEDKTKWNKDIIRINYVEKGE